MNEWMSKLERAKALFDAGALTQEEFEAEKFRLLPRGGQPAGEQEAHAKHDDADLSEKAFGYRVAGPSRGVRVGIAAVVIVAAGSAIYFLTETSTSRPDPAAGVRDSLARADTATKDTILPPVPASIPAQPNDTVRANQCKSGELKILMPGVGSKGSIVVNYPLDDTDGMGSLRFGAHQFICVSPAQLARFATPGSTDETSSDVLVSFDPAGGRRSSLDYSVLFCSELPDTPEPPRSLKFGEFRWRGQRAAPEVSVRWHPDFRRHIESDCFCDDGSTAPCTTEKPRDQVGESAAKYDPPTTPQ